ncbi:MAG: hypothetical protein ACT4P4_00775, partial [Betaproteobacteria bacterium]
MGIVDRVAKMLGPLADAPPGAAERREPVDGDLVSRAVAATARSAAAPTGAAPAAATGGGRTGAKDRTRLRTHSSVTPEVRRTPVSQIRRRLQ